MIPAAFDYVRAESADHAIAQLAEHGDEAKLLAGGMSLLPLMKLRLATPTVVIDVGRIEADVTERGPIADLFAIFERIADGLAMRPNGLAPGAAASRLERPPMAAFENFIKGVLAETPATAIAAAALAIAMLR